MLRPFVLLILLVFVVPAATVRRGLARRAPTRSPSTGEHLWAARTLQRLSLRDLVAQLVIVPCYGENPNSRSREYKEYARAVRDLHVGGMIVLNRYSGGQLRQAEPHAMAAFFNRMQRLAPLPLLVAGDFERGASMRVANTTKYPHAMAYGATGDPALSRALGAATARESRALGVNWVFAPDADVNNNPENPIINIRSYGENPSVVASHVQAFIEGAHNDPAHRVLVTVKHFPGHGDTATDSHLGLGQVGADRARLDAVEFVPFRAAIAVGVDAVMTAHLSVPALEPEPIPATVSPRVLTGVLRNELGFGGLIVTDAMDMQGLAKELAPGEAAIRALEAGADVLLMPPQPADAIAAVSSAVASGRLARARVEASVRKLLDAKARLGLLRQRLVDLDALSDQIDSPEAAAQAQQVAGRALTLIKNDANLLPLQQPERACLYVLAEGRYSQQGRRLTDELRRRQPALKTTWLDPSASSADLAAAARSAADCAAVIVAPFVSVANYRGTVALGGDFVPFVQGLVAGKAPVVMVAFGNPYLLRTFPTVSAYLATFSTVPASEVAVAQALLGELPVQGHLPVTIPSLARYGDGLSLAARSAVTNP